MTSQLFLGAFLASVVALGSYAFRFLTLSGSIAALVLGIIVFGIGGWQWAIPLLTFFVLSSLLSKYGRARKARYDEVFGKTHTRDWGQVGANGGVAGAIVLLSAWDPVHDFYPMYLGALAAVTADTWGTETGILTKGRTRFILSMQSVSPGTSGGISMVGSIAGTIGATAIALSGYAWSSGLKTAIIVVLAGMMGTLCDSVLGATLQVQFRCELCGKQTERKVHCGRPTTQVAGRAWINNDVVNLLCSFAGAVAAWALSVVTKDS